MSQSIPIQTRWGVGLPMVLKLKLTLPMLMSAALAAGLVSWPNRAEAQEFADRYRAYQQHVGAGRSALHKNKYTIAIDHYTKAIEMSPFVPSLYFDRGLASYKTDHHERAMEDFNKVIVLDPRRSAAYVYRGLCRMKQGDFHGALSDYTTALSRNPEDATVHNNLAWLYATAEDESFRDKAKALEHAEQAAAISKRGNAEILDTLARAYFVNDQTLEAIDAEKRALRLDPENGAFKEHQRVYEKKVASAGARP